MNEADLVDITAFAAVARERSFRGAAARRNVSASSLSEAVRRLEARLGVRLLNRTTRSVTATEAGARLLDRLGPALQEVAAALDEVNSFRDSPTGTVRLNVPSAVARLVLPAIVIPFLKAHPGVVIEVTAEDAFTDVLAAGFDAGVRYEERLEKDMIAVPIGPRRQRFLAVASPDYIRRHGRPLHPNDLLGHACIRHRFATRVLSVWEFERRGEVIKITPQGPLIAESLELELAAAIAGLGVLCSFEGLFAPAIARGELEPLLEDWCEPFSGPYLYYANRRHMPAPLRAFIDFVQKEGRG